MSMFEPDPDPTATFHLDQVEGASEEATRDQQNWTNHLEVHAHNIAHAQSMATRNLAVAAAWRALAFVLRVAGVVGAVVTVVEVTR